jgi:hypothetical protein
MFEAPDIPGAADVIAWFGYWPTFHDAEVLAITMDRERGITVAVHVFHTTSEIDSKGHYIHDKHAIIRFSMTGFPADETGFVPTKLQEFNHQNVLSSARVEKRDYGWELILDPCFGVCGSIACERMSASVEPGVPPGQYQDG